MPALLYRPPVGGRQIVAVELLQATSLSFIVAAARIWIELGALGTIGTALPPAGYSRWLSPVSPLRLYAEEGLARQQAALWLYAENLTIAYQDQPLAHYTVTYEGNQHAFKTVGDPQLVETAFRSPQLPLWELTKDEWHKVVPPR